MQNMEGAELTLLEGSSGGSALRNPPAKAEDTGDAASIPGREDPLEEGTAAHSSVLPGEPRGFSHGQRSLADYSP